MNHYNYNIAIYKRLSKSHQLDCEAEGKEMAWDGWRRVKATTKSHRTEVISDPPLLVICVPGQPLELTWIEEAYHQIVRYLDHVP